MSEKALRKKLIEVALPLEAINREAAREKSIRHGHPSTLHLWWARRPLAACRAVLFAQLVDDPSAWPELYPDEKAQEKERKRLFGILENLVPWQNSNDEAILDQARREIARSIARNRISQGKGDESDERDAAVLAKRPSPKVVNDYLATVAPPVYDPFCGGGSIPLEAQRLGLRAYGSDLNPVAVLITKALIEIPPKFAGWSPVNPESRKKIGAKEKSWQGAQGLAEDVRYYGQWMREQAEKKIGHLYPKVQLPEEHGGKEATVIAWLWARTVRSSNPAFSDAEVPLVSSFWLSKKKGRETWLEPVIDKDEKTFRFEIRTGKPDKEKKKIIAAGTKLGRGAKFQCVFSGDPIPPEHLKKEGLEGRLGARMMAIVAEGNRRRIYLPAEKHQEKASAQAKPTWGPEQALPNDPRAIWCVLYGLDTFEKLFTPRQLVALTTFSDLVGAAREKATEDAVAAGMPDEEQGLESSGTGATAYGEAIASYLAFGISRSADYWANLVSWHSGAKMEALGHVFVRHALPMIWDFAEGNPLSNSSGNWSNNFDWVVRVLKKLPATSLSKVSAKSAFGGHDLRENLLFSTDPPYYDNIGYADLSDFFYVWLRRSLGKMFPDLFSTLLVPKAEELVATPYRFGGSKEKARDFFEEGLGQAFEQMHLGQQDDLPLTIYYAFKQSETKKGEDGVASTGWETMLEGLLSAGFAITGTWPMRTELSNRMIGMGTSALASSIVLVCRKRPQNAPSLPRARFRRLLRQELPQALAELQQGNIAPVDMAQAAIGPGMSIFSRYASILEADGSRMTVRTALQLINRALDEFLSEQEGEFDASTRFAITWFETHGLQTGPYGEAETLATARNVSVSGVAEAGLAESKGGTVRLLLRSELPEDWKPAQNNRFTVWEATQQVIRTLEHQGEAAAAELLNQIPRSELCRDLAYRLYQVCDRKSWAEEARAYNGLVTSWPELQKQAAQSKPQQESLFQEG